VERWSTICRSGLRPRRLHRHHRQNPPPILRPSTQGAPGRKSRHTRGTRDQGSASNNAPMTADNSNRAPAFRLAIRLPHRTRVRRRHRPLHPIKSRRARGANWPSAWWMAIDTEKNKLGDTFHRHPEFPPKRRRRRGGTRGRRCDWSHRRPQERRQFAGQSVLVLQLDSIALGSRTYNIQTDHTKNKAVRGARTPRESWRRRHHWSIIGAIAGGGKGAAIWRRSWRRRGRRCASRNQEPTDQLPSETILNFTLQAPVTVVKAPNRAVIAPNWVTPSKATTGQKLHWTLRHVDHRNECGFTMSPR